MDRLNCELIYKLLILYLTYCFYYTDKNELIKNIIKYFFDTIFCLYYTKLDLIKKVKFFAKFLFIY